ncbi:CRISPR-associated protein Cas4 [Nanoarchaeota archaeon]
MISVSMLNAYLYCKRKLFIEQVLGLRIDIPKEATIKGSVRHYAYELINNYEKSIIVSIKKVPKLDDLKRLYKSQYLKYLKQALLKFRKELRDLDINLIEFFKTVSPFIIAEAFYRAETLLPFIQKTGFLGEDLWENLEPKIQAEVFVGSDNLGMRGKIDQLEVFKDEYVPVELKTGKMPQEGVWHSHKIQLAAYCMLLEDKYNKIIDKGYVRYLDEREKRLVILNPFIRDYVKELIEKVNNLFGSKEVPDFADSINKCKICELKDVCHDKVAVEKLLVKLNKEQ